MPLTSEKLHLRNAINDLQFDFHQAGLKSDLPLRVNELFQNSGKMFRPALCFIFAKIFGLTIKEVSSYAKAVEMTHTASLIHDDVIDEAHERRKYPTINSQKPNALAVLSGDFLLASVIAELASKGELEIITDLTWAIKSLADGEWLQFHLKETHNSTLAQLKEVSLRKTSSLMIWSCVTPAKLSGQSQEVIKHCDEFGQKIGLIFQMLDDVNDFNPDSGKPFAQDLETGLINFVSYYILEDHPQLKEELLKYSNRSPFPWQKELQMGIERVIDETKRIENELNQHLNLILAHSKLSQIEQEGVKKLLDELIQKLRKTFTKNLTSKPA